jgi:hypothetical protein
VQKDVKSVMVCTDDGSPIALYMDVKGKVLSKQANESGFAAYLTQLGFPVKVSVSSV